MTAGAARMARAFGAASWRWPRRTGWLVRVTTTTMTMNGRQLRKPVQGPVKNPPRLGNGQCSVSLDAAAFFLGISRGTVQARVDGLPGKRAGAAARYLTPRQFEKTAEEVARYRSSGMLPLDEAARYLEMSEHAVMGHVATGKLRECRRGAAFFATRELDLFQARMQGVVDPISTYRADKLFGRGRGHTNHLVQQGWLEGVRVGRTTFVSKMAVAVDARRRRRLEERLRVLCKAGRLLASSEAAAFLGASKSLVTQLARRGILKFMEPKRVKRRFFRLRDLERFKALNVVTRKAPPENLLGTAEVTRALDLSKSAISWLVKKGQLRVTRSGLAKSAALGFDPRDVERLKAERQRLNALVTSKVASEILLLQPWTLGSLVRQGLILPLKGKKRDTYYYDPEELRAMRDAPFVVEARRRARLAPVRAKAKSLPILRGR